VVAGMRLTFRTKDRLPVPGAYTFDDEEGHKDCRTYEWLQIFWRHESAVIWDWMRAFQEFDRNRADRGLA
jgi:hypothetical protein